MLLLLLLLLVACPGSAPPPNDDDVLDDDDSGEDDDDVLDDDDSGEDDDDSSASDDDDATPPATEQQLRGAEAYGTYCAHCHGEEGEGYAADFAPMLANQGFLATATDSFLHSAITHGRPGTTMSAWSADYGGPLTPDDIDDVVSWLRFWQVVPDEDVHDEVLTGDPTQGLGWYGAACSECHGAAGEGGTGPSLANPWFLETASDGFLRSAIDAGRSGTPMPAWGDVLDDAQVGDLVALLRSWATPVEDTPVPPFAPDLSQPVIHPEGAPADFSDALIEGLYVPVADVAAAYDAGESLVLLDARPGSDYLFGHISGAVSVPFYRVDDVVPFLPQDTWLVAYCGCPHELSGQVADQLTDLGFAYTAVLDEGWFEWLTQGHPSTVGPEQF